MDPTKIKNPFGSGFWMRIFSGVTTPLWVGIYFTTSSAEVWGSNRRDPLADIFKDLMRSNEVCDVCPVPLSPTWRNCRVEGQGVAKRLDCFMLNEDLAYKVDKYRVWHVSSIISDHVPIFLQLGLEGIFRNYPYKFNHHRLELPDFQALVRNVWRSVDIVDGASLMDSFLEKLRLLKGLVRAWEKNHKMKRVESLVLLEGDIANIFSQCSGGIFSKDDLIRLQSLEGEKQRSSVRMRRNGV